MKLLNLLLPAWLTLAALAGCAAGEPPRADGASIEVRQAKSDNMIKVSGTQNRFHVMGTYGNLFAGAFNKDDKLALGAGVDKGGMPKFYLVDAQMKASVALALDDSGEPMLFLGGKSEEGWIDGAFSKVGLPLLALNTGDEKSGARAKFSFTAFNGVTSPYMLMQGENPKASVLTSFKDGKSAVTEMTDSKGRVRVRLGIGADDKPFIEMLDEDGKPQGQKAAR